MDQVTPVEGRGSRPPTDDDDALLPPDFPRFDNGVAVARRPELVVALVAALGTSVQPVVDALTAAFKGVNYDAQHVRISELLEDAHKSGSVDVPKEGSRSRWLMDLGDRLRMDLDLPAAACALGVLKIRRQRRATQGSPDDERPGVVTIIRSVKRPEEIALLQSVYGARLLVVGVSATEVERRDALVARLKIDNQGENESWYAAEAVDLLGRDQAGRAGIKAEKKFGQQVRKAFEKADTYVWLRPGRPPLDAVTRIVKAWFGEPFTTPDRDEQAMYHADAAKFRSAAAGRQVGVAIVDTSGEVLVTGANDVPKPGGGQYWPGDVPDHRDFTMEYEMNDRVKLDVALDVLDRLQKAGLLNEEEVGDKTLDVLASEALAADGVLEDSRIADLLEFGRIMHAEMAAISTAARRGTPLLGSTLYTTTYPCHECARLIIGSGIRRVVFVDPYPKSQVIRLFGNQVTDDADQPDGAKVVFVPFEGVAPVLFSDVFLMNKRERTVDGTFETWVPSPLAVRIPDGAPPLSNETGVLTAFRNKYRASEWVPEKA